MRRFLLITTAVSLGLNAWLIHRLAAARLTESPLPEAQGAARPVPVPMAGASVPPVTPASKNAWTQLYSRNVRVFLANLGEAGCPENIQRNLVSAEINRLFEERQKPLRTIEDYWLDGPELESEERRRGAAQVELERERQKYFEEILQVPWTEDPTLDDNEEMLAALGWFCSPERAPALRAVLLRGRVNAGAFQALHGKARGPEIQFAAENLISSYNEELAAVLEPEELEELKIRFFEVGYFDVWKEQRRFGKKLEDQQLREVLNILKPDQLLPMDFDDYLDNPQIPPAQSVLQGHRLRAVLGEETFADFLRRHNGDPHSTPGWSDEGKPGPEVFLKLFELKEEFTARINGLGQSYNLPDAFRIQMVKRRLGEARERMSQLLPAEYAEQYLDRAWIQQLETAYVR